MTDTDPLIISAVLADGAQDDLDAQRRRWFPAERLQVGAHVTLFHALPGDRIDEVTDVLAQVTRGRTPPALRVEEPFGMGPASALRGVGYRLRSRALEDAREDIARPLRDVLSEQDARRWRPHVTIQNKVDDDEARRALRAVTEAHTPYETTVPALALWRYRRGPWEEVDTFRFLDT